MKYCENCNKEIEGELASCPNCNGALIEKQPEASGSAGFAIARPVKRWGSTVLDQLMISIPTGIIFAIFVFNLNRDLLSMDVATPEVMQRFMAISISLSIFYNVIFLLYSGLMIGKYGATLGQKIVKAKVLTEQGSIVDFKKSFLRALAYLLYSVPYVGVILYLVSAILVFADKKRQTIHDKLCKTVVVDA